MAPVTESPKKGDSRLVASESYVSAANRPSVAAVWPAIAPIQCCATVFSSTPRNTPGGPAARKITKRQFGRPAQARMTRTLTERLAAIGAAINHERQEYARSTHEPASLALAG